MAELDIKDIWARGKDSQSSQITINVDDVIGKKSKNVLYWVKFILWIEFWLSVASFPLIIWSTLQEEVYGLKVLNVSVLAIMFLYLFYYQFLIRKISKFDYTDDVYSSLTRIYGYLKFYLLHYRVIVWLIMPLSFFFSIYIAFTETPGHQQSLPAGSEQFWIFIGICLVICLIIMLIMHFLVNLIYGRKIKKLRNMIRELGS